MKHRPADRSAAGVNGDSDASSRPVIMIVEDNEWVQSYVQKIFSADYEVVVAADGLYALDELKTTTPDLIILDIMMPRMDGNELFKRLKENEQWAHIPVIMFSAMSSEESRLEGLEKGADDYIGKPFNPRELIARANNLIQLRFQEKELKKLNAELETRVQTQVAVILSQRKRYERELIAAKDKAEESDRLKSFILKNMSHEIRTPITNILGFAEILSERVENEDKQFTAYIETNGKRLLDTVTAILDFSKLTTDNFELVQLSAIDINEVAHDAVHRYEAHAETEGLVLRADCTDPAPSAQLDRAALDRILNHLISNAIKFTQKGEIVVRTGTDDEYIFLEVQDTGIGISEEFKPELFAPFKQESVGEARTFEGTGLGLSICQRLVQLMDGRISFESRKGHGTTFRVALPMLAKRSPDSGNREPVAHAAHKPASSGSAEIAGS